MTTPPTFDAFILAAVVAELRHTVVGARVQKIQQPSANDLILSVYGRAGAQRLLISADPRQFRAHLTQVKRDNPITPPAFCQLCRKYLDGAAVLEVEMPAFDRLFQLTFRTHDGEKVVLVAELMGRNSNLVLVSGAGIVRGVMRPTPADSERPLRAGLPYQEPPGAGNLPLGKFAAGEITARAEETGETIETTTERLMDEVRAERFEPYSIMDAEGHTVGVWAFEPLTVPAGLRYPRETMSVALDTFHATLAERTEESGERAQLTKALAREIQFREKELHSARTTIAEAARSEEYERHGNNLLAQLTLVEKGAASVTIADLYAEDGGSVTLTLDPKKTPQENAESFFVRARKVRDAADYADGKAADLEAELAELRGLESELQHLSDTDDLVRLRTELAGIVGAARASGKSAAERPKAPSERPFGGFKVRTFTVEGYQLLVGESAEANDYLVTRVASPSDLWFHVHAAAGAHGILRTQGQPSRVPDTIIRRAAEIVAARSGKGEKHAEIVPVDVTEKRYVRKPRGAKPGMVTYERARCLDVSPKL
jgi:predicted ribosome quality control (RQC) complex YloA/Tae2 family protein